MTGYMEFYLIAALAIVAIGYLGNAFAFLSAHRFPMLRLLDGKDVTAAKDVRCC